MFTIKLHRPPYCGEDCEKNFGENFEESSETHPEKSSYPYR